MRAFILYCFIDDIFVMSAIKFLFNTYTINKFVKIVKGIKILIKR